MIIDTHAHLTDEVYKDVDKLICDLKDNNIEKVFCVAYNKTSILKTLELAKKYQSVYAIVGVHPCDITEYNAQIEKLITVNKTNIIAIGEIGLDYHFEDSPSKKKQKEGFIKQLVLADKLSLPIVIHNRDSAADMLEILKEYKHLLNNGGVFHCFSEDYEFFKEIKKLGLKISVGGTLTFKNNLKVQDAVKQIDIKDIVLETDCPYLTPVPFRGKVINEPKYTNLVAKFLADLKGISVYDVEKITTKNAKQIFRIED